MEIDGRMKHAKENASSIIAKRDVIGLKEIGQETVGKDVFTYYQDEGENYYYTSRNTLRLNMEMEDAQKRKVKRKIHKWKPEKFEKKEP